MSVEVAHRIRFLPVSAGVRVIQQKTYDFEADIVRPLEEKKTFKDVQPV
jgi:hypothetical protein